MCDGLPPITADACSQYGRQSCHRALTDYAPGTRLPLSGVRAGLVGPEGGQSINSCPLAATPLGVVSLLSSRSPAGAPLSGNSRGPLPTTTGTTISLNSSISPAASSNASRRALPWVGRGSQVLLSSGCVHLARVRPCAWSQRRRGSAAVTRTRTFQRVGGLTDGRRSGAVVWCFRMSTGAHPRRSVRRDEASVAGVDPAWLGPPIRVPVPVMQLSEAFGQARVRCGTWERGS